MSGWSIRRPRRCWNPAKILDSANTDNVFRVARGEDGITRTAQSILIVTCVAELPAAKNGRSGLRAGDPR